MVARLDGPFRVTGTLLEAPYHITPSQGGLGRPQLYIFGDSVTAGTGAPGSPTWPRLLASVQAVEIHDYSQPGATVQIALRKAREVDLGPGLILLEIGGND